MSSKMFEISKLLIMILYQGEPYLEASASVRTKVFCTTCACGLFPREIEAKGYSLSILEEANGWKGNIQTLAACFSTTTGVILKSSVDGFFSLSLGPHRKLEPRKELARYNLSPLMWQWFIVNYRRQQWKVTSVTWM